MDLDSNIQRFQVQLLHGTDSCSVDSAENLTSVVDWTALPGNSSSYTFTHISLHVCVLSLLSFLEIYFGCLPKPNISLQSQF